MFNKRFIWHLSFWVVYFAVNLFNELYLSSSFTNNPSAHLIVLAVISQLLTLIVKVPLVYIVLYYLIPKWFTSPNKKGVVLKGILLLVMATILHRLVIQQVVWPYVYGSEKPDFTVMQQTARLFYSLLDLLQVTGIAAAIRLFRMRIRAVKKEKSLVQEKLQAEILLLKSQINPHFLFNSLNTLFALTRSKSEEAPEAVMRLSNILRHMIYETDQETTTVGKEIKILQDYIDLQRIRFGERIHVSLEKDIDNESARIVPLLLLPLVENAFKHGVSGTAGSSEISIRIWLSGSRFTLEIVNPAGGGRSDEMGETGIGISNIRRQLELQYGEYGFDADLKGGEFIVHLWINLETYEGPELFDRGG